MIYQNYIKELTETIERKLTNVINKYEHDIVSIILGWDSSKTKVLIWLRNVWEDFGYFDEDEAITILDAPSFSELINEITEGKSLSIKKKSPNFPEFGDVLSFSNPENEKSYNIIRNAMLQALVDVSQNICKNQSIGKFNNLVSFKVMGLSDGEHPEISAIYSDDGYSDLMFVELENDNASVECYCKIAEQSLVFFLTNIELLEEWRGIFNSEKQTYYTDYENITNFSLIKDKFGNYLNLNTTENGIFNIKEVSGNQKHCLHELSDTIDTITETLRNKSRAIEKKQLEMPSPEEETEFVEWCNNLKETKNDFGWRDLEIAVAKYGISFIYKFIPHFYKENKYYDITLLTAVNELLKAGDFGFANECFDKLSAEKRAENEMLLIDILLGQEKFKEALLLIEKKGNEEPGKWDKIRLTYRKALVLSESGDINGALKQIKTIEKEDRNNDYDWMKALIIANQNELEALTILRPLLQKGLPIIPSETHFKKFPAINALFAERNLLLENVKNNDKIIINKKQTVKLTRTSHHYFPLLADNLKSEHPTKWEVLAELAANNGFALSFFNFNRRNYCFTSKGYIYEIVIENNTLKFTNEKLIEKEAATVYVYKNLLYIGTTNNSVVIYNIEKEQVTGIINRLIDKAIDYLFANENHVIISSTAGVEVFGVTTDNYHLISLLSVGTSTLPYTWAKQAIIIDDYLYIAAGNAGLVVYKMKGNNEPEFINMLSCDFDKPFCTEITHYQNMLIINMEGNHWIVDISDPEDVKSVTALFGGPKSSKFGPFIQNNTISFIENDKPIVWNYSFEKEKQKIVCEYLAKGGVEIYPYYLKQAVLIDSNLLLATKNEFYLLQHTKAKQLNISQLSALQAETDNVYNYLEKELTIYFSQNKEQKAGFVIIESLYGELKLSILGQGLLTELISYKLEEYFEKEGILKENGLLFNVPDVFPYDTLFEKEQKQAIYKLSCELLHRLSNAKQNWFSNKVYFIFSGYNPVSDRNTYSIEYVLTN